MPQQQQQQSEASRTAHLVPYLHAAAIKQTGTHEYTCTVHPGWSYGAAAHGGFLIALAWRAIETHFATTLQACGQPHTVAFHIEFLRPVAVDECRITIRDLRIGKGTSTVRAMLSQRGKEKCMVYATNAGPAASRGAINLPMGYHINPPPPPIDFEACMSGKDRNWIRYGILGDPSLPRAAKHNAITCIPRRAPSQKNTTFVWMTPRLPSERWYTSMLALVLDNSTPAVENFFPDSPHNFANMAERSQRHESEGRSNYDHPPWLSEATQRSYPTLSLSIQVERQLPPEGVRWLGLGTEIKEVVEGRCDLSTTLWDPEGNLIAISQGTYFVVDASRSLNARMGGGGGSKI